MTRYAPDHTSATRRRMLDASARRFKSDGFDGAGIATLVADAGLTNGAFYGHFASKDALIATVVAEQLAAQADAVDALPHGAASLVSFITDYLSPAHRDNSSDGCPSAALLPEIGRQTDATRDAYTTGTKALLTAIERQVDAVGVPDARGCALALFTTLVASLQLARAVTDPDLSDNVLASARQRALALVGVPSSPHQES